MSAPSRKADIAKRSHVRFGSKADVAFGPRHVRFTPKSGHRRATVGCLLCAIRRHPVHARVKKGRTPITDHFRDGVPMHSGPTLARGSIPLVCLVRHSGLAQSGPKPICLLAISIREKATQV